MIVEAMTGLGTVRWDWLGEVSSAHLHAVIFFFLKPNMLLLVFFFPRHFSISDLLWLFK